MALPLPLATLDAAGVRAAVEAARAAAGALPEREQLRARAEVLALRLLLGLVLRAGAPRVRDALVVRAAEQAQQGQHFGARALTLNEYNAVQLVCGLCREIAWCEPEDETLGAPTRAISATHTANRPSRPTLAPPAPNHNSTRSFTRQRIARLATGDTTPGRLRASSASTDTAATPNTRATRATRASDERRRAAREYGNMASLKYRLMHSHPSSPKTAA